VIGKMDFTDLESQASKKFEGSREMNGIAWNAASGSFYITGKCWPTVYEIKIAD
jgi:glutamine cyclotransferase